MIKHELLVPAGNMQSLNQAIANGADAVYIGCKKFGARKFAENFNNDEVLSAIKLCHLYGVKIYATMNTLIKDEEVPCFLEQVEFLYKNGIDAILIQDFGMLCLVREKYPNLEIHASTQANTSSKETAELFYNLGIKRVVFSREMTLEEIENITVPIEKEVFVHGALCICYSGCCLMSSMLGNRSGNRGECAGSCRLPYTLKKNNQIIEDNKYLLSTKELNTSANFKKLLDSNITSFKIEGRMKSPEYVGFITRFYRNIIDNYSTNIDLEKENSKLKTIFNRGFTLGHLFETAPDKLMNQISPNHIGLEIGRVIEVTDKKIKIKLSKELNQQDGIRFLNSGKGFIVNYLYDEHDNLINSATNICYVDNKVGLKEKDIVCKTQDYKLLSALKKLPVRKIPVTFKVIAKLNKPLEIEISDGINDSKVVGSIIQKSKTAPISEEKIKKQIEKLGDTPFISQQTTILADQEIFIPIKELNELRRSLIKKLTQIRMDFKQKILINNVTFDTIKNQSEHILTVSVRNEKQLQICNDLKIKRIYVEDHMLYKKYEQYENIYYKLPRCNRSPIDNLEKKNLVSDYFDFSLNKHLIGNYGLNVTNIYTAYYLYKNNLKTITLSVELTEEEIKKFINNYIKTFNTPPNIEIIAYGRIENMIIKGNILNLKECESNYELVDQKRRTFPVYYDGENTHILNYEEKQLSNINDLKKYANIRLDFYDEDEQSIKNIISRYQ